MVKEFEHIATGRHESLFREDIESRKKELIDGIRGRRIAVIGASGSIGASVLRSLLPYGPRALALVDISENNLVETVRDLRSSEDIELPEDFQALPLAMGSVECTRFFRERGPFDYIFNLAAIKHVRSEKDIYCLIRMIDTNVIFPFELMKALPYRCMKLFSVSSDKSTAPVNLMGASKMAMEKMLLANSADHPYSSARFANVAFSDGSLPHGFLSRISKKQPIAAPVDVRRYFMSHEEAGQICVLSCVLGENRDVFFPRLMTRTLEKTFKEIALDLLSWMGYEPVECATEKEAKRTAAELIRLKKWPCYFFTSDTTGEKSAEEFYGGGESPDFDTYTAIGVVKNTPSHVDAAAFEAFLRFAYRAKTDPGVEKEDYVRELQKIVPDLHHLERGKNLDQKM